MLITRLRNRAVTLREQIVHLNPVDKADRDTLNVLCCEAAQLFQQFTHAQNKQNKISDMKKYATALGTEILIVVSLRPGCVEEEARKAKEEVLADMAFQVYTLTGAFPVTQDILDAPDSERTFKIIGRSWIGRAESIALQFFVDLQ